MVFAEKGFHAARIQDIAVRARIGVGTVYNHFEQKEDVLLALLEEHTGALEERFASAPSDGNDFESRLRARLRRVCAYQDEHRAFFALSMEHGLIGPTTAAAATVLKGRKPRNIERFRKAFIDFMDEGVRTKALQPGEPARFARVLGGILKAYSIESLIDGSSRLADHADTVVDLFLFGAVSVPKRKVRKP